MSDASDAFLATPWVTGLARHVEEKLGYVIPPHRMIREIAPFAVAEAALRGLPGPTELVEALLRGEQDAFWRALVDVATIGETYFFRHPGQVQTIVAMAGRLHAHTRRPVRLWSAGCSTGEEAYTLAICLEDAGIETEITASDASAAALARAAAGGPYSDRSVGHMPETYRDRWLVREGGSTWRLRRHQELPVRIVEHNLVQDPVLRPRRGAWDIVLCRNVLLYFSQATGRYVVERLGQALEPLGSLWISPSDHVQTTGGPLVWDRSGAERYLRQRGTRDVHPTPRAPSPGRAAAGTARRTEAVTKAWSEELTARLDRGLVAGAREVVERRLAERPDDGAAWVARAALHLHAHEFEEAVQALARARTAHPRPEGLAYFEGCAQLKAGRPSEALVAFLRAVEDDPDDWASSWQAADLYHRQGRTLLEELMLRRTASLLATGRLAPPSFGPAACLVNSVHLQPDLTERLTRERLSILAAGSPPPGEVEREGRGTKS